MLAGVDPRHVHLGELRVDLGGHQVWFFSGVEQQNLDSAIGLTPILVAGQVVDREVLAESECLAIGIHPS